MAEVKYARTSTIIQTREGDRISITANDTWSPDDPLVKQHPEFFVDEPLWLRHTVPTEAEREARNGALGIPSLPRVEQGTKAPGEMRKR